VSLTPEQLAAMVADAAAAAVRAELDDFRARLEGLSSNGDGAAHCEGVRGTVGAHAAVVA
jgi:hypothetical protein